MTARTLVVKCTTAAPEPAAQAFNVASVAAAAGATVSMWLTGDAVHFATPGRAEREELPHAAPLSELRDMILALGILTVCTQCALRRNLTAADLLPGVRIAGAATFVSEVLAEGAQALVY
jgi:predicted peroxiredoxin